MYSYARDGLFFKVFQELDPVTKVPAKGAWITCLFMGIVSFFLNLEELTFLVSIGNLITYAIVHAAVMVLRFRESGSVERTKPEKFVWFYMVFAFFFALSFGYGWHIVFTGIFGIAALILLVYLHFIP